MQDSAGYVVALLLFYIAPAWCIDFLSKETAICWVFSYFGTVVVVLLLLLLFSLLSISLFLSLCTISMDYCLVIPYLLLFPHVKVWEEYSVVIMSSPRGGCAFSLSMWRGAIK